MGKSYKLYSSGNGSRKNRKARFRRRVRTNNRNTQQDLVDADRVPYHKRVVAMGYGPTGMNHLYLKCTRLYEKQYDAKYTTTDPTNTNLSSQEEHTMLESQLLSHHFSKYYELNYMSKAEFKYLYY